MALPIRRVGFAAVCLVFTACGDDGSSNSTSDGTTSLPPTTLTSPATTMTVDDTGTGTGSESGSSSSESSTGPIGPVCPDTHQCFPAVPEDWNGPVVRNEHLFGEDAPECEGDYTELEEVGSHTLVAEPATCTCSCGDPDPDMIECDNTATLRYFGDDAECTTNVPVILTVVTGACNPFGPTFPGDSYWLIDPIEASGGACVPASEQTMDDAAFESTVSACGGAELLEGCGEGELCAPTPADAGALCIWQEGDHECPEGYDDPQLLFTEIDDQRGCGMCTCGDPAGICDGAVVNVLNNNCAPPPLFVGVFAADGECHLGNSLTAQSATYMPDDPTAFCAPSEGAPMGEATPTTPVTICCTATD